MCSLLLRSERILNPTSNPGPLKEVIDVLFALS